MRTILCAIVAFAASFAEADDLYVFTRPGCSPCEKLRATIERDPLLTAGHTLYLIDTKKYPEIAQKYRIKGVPVLILFREGKEISRRVGFSSEQELKEWLTIRLRRRT